MHLSVLVAVVLEKDIVLLDTSIVDIPMRKNGLCTYVVANHHVVGPTIASPDGDMVQRLSNWV